jgi:hypothetical protein
MSAGHDTIPEPASPKTVPATVDDLKSGIVPNRPGATVPLTLDERHRNYGKPA